ncbi:right-handed parallel beta-helix repeat-containing protein [Citrobacter farmeri]
MTVSTEVDHNEYTGNGVTTTFPYTFRIFQKSDLVVQVVDLDENITLLVLDTDYTVTGAGGYTGGNVILTAALTNGYQISISRDLPVTQETDLRNQGKFFAEVHEDAFDKLTMLVQQVRSYFSLALRKPSFVANYYDAMNNYISNLRDPDKPQDAATRSYVDSLSDSNINRSLRVPESFIPPLPAIEFRKNKVVGMDDNGNPIMLLPESGSATDVLLMLANKDGESLIGGATYEQIRQSDVGGDQIKCLGRESLNDGGEGWFFLDSSDTSTPDNGGTVLVDASGKRWKRQIGDEVKTIWFTSGNGTDDDTTGFQSAIDATPWGGVLTVQTPPVYYNLTAPLLVNKPITITGNGGSTVSRKQMPCLKFPVGINGFVLVPTYDGFRFTYGITGVVIRDIMLEGVSNVSTDWAGYAFSVDETVNGGDYHVRECSFENIHVRYFDHAFTLRGSIYLNNFIGVHAIWCGVGVRIDRNSLGFGYSDQNRFFGCEFVLNRSGIILSATGHAGSQTIHGCTISENTVQGAVFGYNVTLSFVGNTVEKNPVGLTILIPSTVTNPASECAKTISGNWFLINTVAILVSKSTAVLTGGFAFPLLIEGNSFNQTVNEVLKVVAPSGAGEFDSRQFIFSSSNSYSATGETLGPVPDSKISSDWAGYNGFHEDGKITISARVNGTTVTNAGFFIVPAGHQCYVKYKMLSIPTVAANGRDQTTCDIKFMNVTTSTPVVIHQNPGGRSGSFTISRSAAGAGGMRVSIDMAAISSTHTAMAEIEVCII